MQWTQQKKYLAIFGGAVILGALLYGGKQFLAARELARLNENRIDGGFYSQPLSYEGAWYLVPPHEIYSSGVEQGGIPALINPATMTIVQADEVIADDLGGIAVEINGEARFYPVQIMNWHEVVHDSLGGESILVYYGPLTGAAAVYELPEGKRFTVSGREYNNDVFLTEEGTETLWSGIRGTPVVAATEMDFQASLTPLSSTFMTWREWKDIHDAGSVLSTATGYERDYTRHPYGNYENSPGVYFPVNHSALPVRSKEPVYLAHQATTTALFINTVTLLDQTPHVQTHDACLVALRDHALSFAQIFDCQHNDRFLTFTRVDAQTYTDAETGSLWNADGLAIDGVLQGIQLIEVPTVRLYTFAADALYPEATIMGSEFVFDEEEVSVESITDESSGTVIEGDHVDGATIEVLPVE
jgi:hypothetical protein